MFHVHCAVKNNPNNPEEKQLQADLAEKSLAEFRSRHHGSRTLGEHCLLKWRNILNHPTSVAYWCDCSFAVHLHTLRVCGRQRQGNGPPQPHDSLTVLWEHGTADCGNWSSQGQLKHLLEKLHPDSPQGPAVYEAWKNLITDISSTTPSSDAVGEFKTIHELLSDKYLSPPASASSSASY